MIENLALNYLGFGGLRRLGLGRRGLVSSRSSAFAMKNSRAQGLGVQGKIPLDSVIGRGAFRI